MKTINDLTNLQRNFDDFGKASEFFAKLLSKDGVINPTINGTLFNDPEALNDPKDPRNAPQQRYTVTWFEDIDQ